MGWLPSKFCEADLGVFGSLIKIESSSSGDVERTDETEEDVEGEDVFAIIAGSLVF